MFSLISRLMLYLGFAFFLCSATRAADVSASIADLSPTAQAKLTSSIKGFLRPKPIEGLSAGDLGWQCQAALTLAELNAEGATGRLTAAAEGLVAKAERARSTGKAIGWSALEEKGPCVPAGPGAKGPAACASGATVYGFQSGLGIACLAAAGTKLARPEITATARDIMAYWNKHRMTKAPCKDCIYFAMSDSAADQERYVRNMNLFVAFGASELGKAGKDPEMLAIARNTMRADMWERENGNRGYLGKLDPIWIARASEADRIENHAAFTALLIDGVGKTLKDPAIDRHALTFWRDWATCDNARCKTAGCKYWAGDPGVCQATATSVHCAFRFRDDNARRLCERYLAETKAVGSVGLWAALSARKP